MCLAVPGKITEIHGSGIERTGKVDFGGILKEVNLSYVPQAKKGQYVIVHVGFAISIVDEKSAAETLSYLKQINELEDLEPRA